MVYKHKLTGNKMLLKERGEIVSTLYKLDENNNKIPMYLPPIKKFPHTDVNGNICYEIAICDNKNLIKL